MSIEEIIKKLEGFQEMSEGVSRAMETSERKAHYKERAQALKEAIALLRTHPDAQPNEPLTEELEEAIDELKHTGYQPSAFSRFEPFYEDGSEYKKAVDTVESALRKAYRRPPKEG